VVVIHDDEVIPPDTKLWLRVFLELWPFNIEPAGTDIEDSPYGESLRQKWKAFGDLQLEPILSAPIPFDRPSSKASGRERFYGDARANSRRSTSTDPLYIEMARLGDHTNSISISTLEISLSRVSSARESSSAGALRFSRDSDRWQLELVRVGADVVSTP